MDKPKKPTQFTRLAEATQRDLSPEETQRIFDRKQAEAARIVADTDPAAQLEDDLDADPGTPPREVDEEGDQIGIPDWATVPPGFTFPPNGKAVYFYRIHADMTENPKGPDHWCCCWSLSIGDERL